MDTSKDRELLMTRIFDAPRDLMFEVWTNPEHLAHWWGPNGFTITTHEMNFKPGGSWKFTMHGPNNMDFPNLVVYKEIVKPERLVWNHSADENENPGDFESTVTFEAIGEKTKITMRMVFRTKEEKDMVVEKYGAIEGNTQTMNRLEAYLTQLK